MPGGDPVVVVAFDSWEGKARLDPTNVLANLVHL